MHKHSLNVPKKRVCVDEHRQHVNKTSVDVKDNSVSVIEHSAFAYKRLLHLMKHLFVDKKFLFGVTTFSFERGDGNLETLSTLFFGGEKGEGTRHGRRPTSPQLRATFRPRTP